MQCLSSEFGFLYEHFNSHRIRFEQLALNHDRNRVLSLNNRSDINWEILPSYRGSHFIRDPRDLLVSGYHYHLWTTEQWCNTPDFDWSRIVGHPYFHEYIEYDRTKYPQNISYQEYLGALDTEKGFILELIWASTVLGAMQEWDYDNPRILELKYEDIIGDENKHFRKLFEHYQFHPTLIDRGVEIADQFSLKNSNKSNEKHIRKGTPGDWKNYLTQNHKRIIKETWGNLLIRLGYEQDTHW